MSSQCINDLLNLNCLTITAEFDGLQCFCVRGDYLMFIFIEPVVLKSIKLFVIIIDLLVECIESFLKYVHLHSQVVEDLCGNSGFCIRNLTLF